MRHHIELIVLVGAAMVLSSHPALAQFSQQGPKLVGTGAGETAFQGSAVSLSADGSTAIVGGYTDNDTAGAAWVWTRNGGVWTRQGNKLVGSGAVGYSVYQGSSVSLSADGNTAIIGGPGDNSGAGAAWVWTRSGGVWTQQGPKLVGTGAVGTTVPVTTGSGQGSSVSLSADGNTAIVGGPGDNNLAGAAWVWTRNGGVWTQQGNKLVGTDASTSAEQGRSVSLSADGNTAIVGGPDEYSAPGAAWVWTRSGGVWTQQGNKLVGSGAVGNAQQGYSVSLSADGSTAIVGGLGEWVWTRSGGAWTQQGDKLVGSGATTSASVSLSADGNTAIVGGPGDNNLAGAAWVWTRSGGAWAQQGNKLVGSGAAGNVVYQGYSVSISGDGNTAIVGGPGDNGNVGAAWVFTAGAPQEPNWMLKSPANSPTARWLPAMTYDAARGQVVLFGGYRDAFGNGNDTWVWDGTNWTQKSPSNSPPPRYGHGLTYDAARGQVVLFGGADSNNVVRNDTWVWDGTNWSQKSPATSPTPRAYPAMAYDAARGRVVLFGGYRGALGAGNDTWVWDGTNWTQESPAISPTPRYGHGIAYDAARAQVVLFGGGWTDTWVWDGTNWTQKSPATGPTARWFHAMAYDVARGQVVLFGGFDNSANLNDSWVWDGTNWTKKSPVTSPPPRNSHALVYDAAREQVVLFGGGGNSNVIYNDTWAWGSASPTGTISVTTNLPAAAFTITGAANYSGSGTSFTQANAPVGTYTIYYGFVIGCATTAPSETKTLAAGTTLSFVGTYQGCTGAIQIDSNIANATFTLSRTNGPSVNGGGPYPISLTSMPIDTYTLKFNAVNGYNTPIIAPQQLSAGASTSFSGIYTISGTAGLGRIQVIANLNAASFGVVATSNTIFLPFTQSGRFFDTGITVPAGTYQITFTPVSGYFTPPSQTLALAPGGTIQFTGTYKRIIVVLFTGFNDHPDPLPPDGVTYPDTCTAKNCPGMAQLAMKIRADTRLQDGVLARTFTYYDMTDYFKWQIDCALLLPCAWWHIPSDETIHQIAETWLTGEARPGPDDRIVIIGHSYGGNRARVFAEHLPDMGYSADLLATIDPIDWNICSIASLGIGCFQNADPFTKVKAVSIKDVQSFTQDQSAAVKGYHFVSYPYVLKYYPSCGIDLCAHNAISQDETVHDAIIDRLVTLRDDPREPVYDVAVSSIGTTTATITWKTGSTTTGGVIYSQNPDATTNSVSVLESTGVGTSHSATITGIVANTRYYFKVRATIPASLTQFSAIGFFQTSQSNVPIIKASNLILATVANGKLLTITLTNYGTAATGGTMTAASIGATKATASFPLAIPDLAPGASFTPVMPFPGNLGASGTTVFPIVTVKYSGTTFSVSGFSVKVP